MSLKVIIIDDEPLIRKGLKAVIDWAALGYEIVAEFSNGKDALAFIHANHRQIDVVFIDIRMPEISGLDVIRKTKEWGFDSIYFVILSGHYEFEYAKKAIQYQVTDYLLKPIQQKELVGILEKINSDYIFQLQKNKAKARRKKASLDHAFDKLLTVQASKADAQYLKASYSSINNIVCAGVKVKRATHKNGDAGKKSSFQMLEAVAAKLTQSRGSSPFSCHIIPSIGPTSGHDIFNVFILDALANSHETTEMRRMYINELAAGIKKENALFQMAIGRTVSSFHQISESHQDVELVRHYDKYFAQATPVFYFEELPQFSLKNVLISVGLSERYIRSIRENNEDDIKETVCKIYRYFKETSLHPKMIDKQLYFFSHKLASVLNETQTKSDTEFAFMDYVASEMNGDLMRESDFVTLSLEFSRQLSRMQTKSSSDILKCIKQDIEKEYATKLTLKAFGKRYFINNVYLGQIFIKEFGEPFIDYLNNFRINQACELLVSTDERIYQIAKMVGFQNPDYFIKKFLHAKGTTPGKYRIEQNQA